MAPEGRAALARHIYGASKQTPIFSCQGKSNKSKLSAATDAFVSPPWWKIQFEYISSERLKDQFNQWAGKTAEGRNSRSPRGLQDITVSHVVNVFVKFECEMFCLYAIPVPRSFQFVLSSIQLINNWHKVNESLLYWLSIDSGSTSAASHIIHDSLCILLYCNFYMLPKQVWLGAQFVTFWWAILRSTIWTPFWLFQMSFKTILGTVVLSFELNLRAFNQISMPVLMLTKAFVCRTGFTFRFKDIFKQHYCIKDLNIGKWFSVVPDR